MGCKTAYEAAEIWSSFQNIEEMDFGGIDSPTADGGRLQISIENGTLTINGIGCNESIAIYDIQGRIVYCGTQHAIQNLSTGLYIVKISNKTVKVTI